MHFLDKFGLDYDVILVRGMLGQKLITLENCINLHNAFVDITKETVFFYSDIPQACSYNKIETF